MTEAELTTEAVESAALAFQGVHNVHSSDGLSLGMLGVGDGVTDDVLKEHLEDTASLLVDQTGDAFHTTSASETADCGFGDPLDVIAENLAMAFRSSLSESFTTLTTSRHDDGLLQTRPQRDNGVIHTTRHRELAVQK
ncbi:hypothetical protein T265_05710 [Opisthorchis viverrini]|uniref:Uncharacterized protein n=1 Tax=Opisthorchis viverrini TaxID=6198 RepID=A0A074ZUZ6_OPIVI|nr:hypothetical protein T265_05710 [Opisthorchis viverrini]KER27175.1 hypothetical protein T265_05710 [Opisthorchis viverrini]